MHSLKKALTRDDPKKYNQTKIEISSIKHNHKYKDIESFLPKVSTHLFRTRRGPGKPPSKTPSGGSSRDTLSMVRSRMPARCTGNCWMSMGSSMRRRLAV